MCQTPGSVRPRVTILTPLHVIYPDTVYIGLSFLLDTVQDVSLLPHDTCTDFFFFLGGGRVQRKIVFPVGESIFSLILLCEFNKFWFSRGKPQIPLDPHVIVQGELNHIRTHLHVLLYPYRHTLTHFYQKNVRWNNTLQYLTYVFYFV